MINNDALMVSNVYAAYTASSNKSDKNLSELSRMLKSGNDSSEKKEEVKAPSAGMDTVIISKEALERLSGMSLAADSKA